MTPHPPVAKDTFPMPPSKSLDAPAAPKSWHPALALLTAPFLPATTARHTQNVPLWQAFLVHALGIGLCFFLDAHLSESVYWNGWLQRRTTNTLRALGAGSMLQTIAPATVLVASFEIGVAVIAGLLMSWGATDEPFRRTFGHALRRTWLQTGHLAFLLAVLCSVMPRMNAGMRRWEHGQVGPPPTRPDPYDPVLFKAYEDALSQRGRLLSSIWPDRAPWYLRYQVLIRRLVATTAYAWPLWGLFRAIGVYRPRRTARRDPRCASCGYNLTGLPLDRRCPECGHPIALSIGPGVRPGTIWQRRRGESLWSALRSTQRQAARTPTVLGRSIRLDPGDRAHRRYLLVRMTPLLFFGMTALPLYDAICAGRSAEPPVHVWWAYLIAGAETSVALLALGFALVACTASQVGVIRSAIGGRNLLSGTVQAACYQAGLLVHWMAVSLLAPICVLAVAFPGDLRHGLEAFEYLARWYPQQFYVWLIFNASAWLFFMGRVDLTRKGFQYASY